MFPQADVNVVNVSISIKTKRFFVVEYICTDTQTHTHTHRPRMMKNNPWTNMDIQWEFNQISSLLQPKWLVIIQVILKINFFFAHLINSCWLILVVLWFLYTLYLSHFNQSKNDSKSKLKELVFFWLGFQYVLLTYECTRFDSISSFITYTHTHTQTYRNKTDSNFLVYNNILLLLFESIYYQISDPTKMKKKRNGARPSK